MNEHFSGMATIYLLKLQAMPIQKKSAFSRRVPDYITEELVNVLSSKKSFEFKQLFDLVHENLRKRKAASGGEEMLRLRVHEKLHNLVSRGMVKAVKSTSKTSTNKKYRGMASLANALKLAEAALR